MTRFIVERPGRPSVRLLSRPNGVQDECIIWLEHVPVADQAPAALLFAQGLRLEGYATSKPHRTPTPGVLEANDQKDVLCVHGRVDAVVWVTNPPTYDHSSLEAHLVTDALVNTASGCAR